MRRLVPALGLGVSLAFLSCTDAPTGPSAGDLSIAITGLPDAVGAAVSVTGPDGFSRAITASGTLADIPTGTYTVTPADVIADDDRFAPPAAFTVRVRNGSTANAAVAYTLTTGRINFTATGLPTGVTATSRLSGPGGVTRDVTVPGLVRGLAPGAWSIGEPETLVDGDRYSAGTVMPLLVAAGTTPTQIPLTFALASGSLNISFDGLPPGVAPRAAFFGPTGRRPDLTAGGLLRGLAPGSYTIQPQQVFDADVRYEGGAISRLVIADVTPTPAPVTYAPQTGRLALAVTGLPNGLTGAVRVRRTLDYDSVFVGRDTIRGVPVGTYTVEGVLVSDGGVLYGTGDAQVVEVAGAQTSTVQLDYAVETSFNIEVAEAYLVQSIQALDGSVPLVAGRDALLRVFAVASDDNGFRPVGVARIREGGTTIFETDLAPPPSGISTGIDQSNFLTSYQANVPGAVLRPGVTLEVTIDPGASIPEADRTDNTLALPLNVRTMAPFRLRFVPIRHTTGGATGDISAANGEAFLSDFHTHMPVQSIEWDVRAPLSTSQPFMTSSVSATWSAILGELNTVRVADGYSGYYAGILKVSYSSGIAGLAYRPGRSSLTWDYFPSGRGVLSHELGHNLTRAHTPCGNPAGVDPFYPYADADIGVFGYDPRTGVIRQPDSKDLMSYCSNEWISDYTFKAVMNHLQPVAGLQGLQASPTATSATPTDVLLIGGRVAGSVATLHPAFGVRTNPVMPTGGSHRLEILAADGRVLYTAGFEPEIVDDLPDGPEAHFTFAVPRAVLGGEPAAIRVRAANGATAERRVPAAPALRLAPRVEALRSADGIAIQAVEGANAGFLVRDPATGLTLGVSLDGRPLTIAPGPTALDVIVSDGVGSSTIRILPPTR